MLRFPLMNHDARISVAGVGGGGMNAVNRMIRDGVRGVDFVTIDTHPSAFIHSEAANHIRIGTLSHGCGGNRLTGCKAAESAELVIRPVFSRSELVFVVAALGGGTGSGAAPAVARIAREGGALTIGVVTSPFSFEGPARRETAELGLSAMRAACDTVIMVPNDRLLTAPFSSFTLDEAFAAVDLLLRDATRGIADVINVTGEINLDLADVRTVASAGPAAIVARGTGWGMDGARDAVIQALDVYNLGISVEHARAVLFNITTGTEVSLNEVQSAVEMVRVQSDPEVEFIFGWVKDERLGDEAHVTLMVTGGAHVVPDLHAVSHLRSLTERVSGTEPPTRRASIEGLSTHRKVETPPVRQPLFPMRYGGVAAFLR
jgi:cell division protein FtsZ